MKEQLINEFKEACFLAASFKEINQLNFDKIFQYTSITDIQTTIKVIKYASKYLGKKENNYIG